LKSVTCKKGLSRRRSPANQFKSVQQGAATSVPPVGLPRLEGVGGRYFGGLQRGRDPSTVRTGNLGAWRAMRSRWDLTPIEPKKGGVELKHERFSPLANVGTTGTHKLLIISYL